MTIDERYLAAPDALDASAESDGPHVCIRVGEESNVVSPDDAENFAEQLRRAAVEAREFDANEAARLA